MGFIGFSCIGRRISLLSITVRHWRVGVGAVVGAVVGDTVSKGFVSQPLLLLMDWCGLAESTDRRIREQSSLVVFTFST